MTDQSVTSTNQSGGITAHTVHFHAARDETADRRTVLAQVTDFHRQRTAGLVSPAPSVAVLGGAMLIMHLAPSQTFDAAQPEAFGKICASPRRLPPFFDTRPRDWNVSSNGFLLGSNGEGLRRPQRAYVHVFRSGVIEAVSSNLARGHSHNALQLPQIQCLIIHYGRIYAAALQSVGIEPPFAVLVSLAGVKKMRLLQDFIGTAFAEDLPYGSLTDDIIHFDAAIFDVVPKDDTHSAKMFYPILSHLANTAQLATSPYFDADGNYTLKPALPAG
jgi:hypothetical protein